jgi:hypothetical protein
MIQCYKYNGGPIFNGIAVDRIRLVCGGGRVVCACDLAVILGLFTTRI